MISVPVPVSPTISPPPPKRGPLLVRVDGVARFGAVALPTVTVPLPTEPITTLPRLPLVVTAPPLVMVREPVPLLPTMSGPVTRLPLKPPAPLRVQLAGTPALVVLTVTAPVVPAVSPIEAVSDVAALLVPLMPMVGLAFGLPWLKMTLSVAPGTVPVDQFVPTNQSALVVPCQTACARAGPAPTTINPVASAVPASNAWRDLAVLPTPIPSPVVLIERFECSIRLTPQ